MAGIKARSVYAGRTLQIAGGDPKDFPSFVAAGVEGVANALRRVLPKDASEVSVLKLARSGRSNVYALFIPSASENGLAIVSVTAEVAYLLDLPVVNMGINQSDTIAMGGIIGNPYDMDGEMIVGALCEALYGTEQLYRHEAAPIKRKVLMP